MDPDDGNVDLDPVFERFGKDRAMLALLARTNATVRAICEEYALATAALERFERAPDAEQRPEVGEYRDLTAELGAELERAIRNARNLQPPDAPDPG